MAHDRRLAGETCYLSPPDETDAERIKSWDNDLEVLLNASMDGTSTPASALYQKPVERSPMLKHMMMIVDAETDAAIGWCMLYSMIPKNRRASLGIIIGDQSYWGRGYGTEAVRLLLGYGFDVLDFHSVELGVYAFNRRAIRCYERVGFQRIGVRRQSHMLGGIAHDTVLMDILASEFNGEPITKSITS